MHRFGLDTFGTMDFGCISLLKQILNILISSGWWYTSTFRSHVRLDIGITDHSTCWPVGPAKTHSFMDNIMLRPNWSCFGRQVVSSRKSDHWCNLSFHLVLSSLNPLSILVHCLRLVHFRVWYVVFSGTSYTLFQPLGRFSVMIKLGLAVLQVYGRRFNSCRSCCHPFERILQLWHSWCSMQSE